MFHEDGGDTPVTVGYGDGTVTLDDIDDGLGVDTAAAFFAGWSLNGVDPATEVALDGSGAVTTYDVYALYTQREEHVITATAEGPGSLSAATMTFLEGDSIDEAELNNSSSLRPTPIPRRRHILSTAGIMAAACTTSARPSPRASNWSPGSPPMSRNRGRLSM